MHSGQLATVRKETRENYQDMGGIRVQIIGKVKPPIAGSCMNPKGEEFPDMICCRVHESNAVWPKDILGHVLVRMSGQIMYFRPDELIPD